ncbi:MAG: hypothetical protein Q6373_018185 [Candidatus Sigynarchaeota archaeon]
MGITFKNESQQPVQERSYGFMIWTMFIWSALYVVYLVMRWLANLDIVSIDLIVLHHVRVFILAIMGSCLLAGILKHRTEQKRELKDVLPGGLKWRLFLAVSCVFTLIAATLNAIKYNSFVPFIDFGGSSRFLRESWPVNAIIECLVNLDVVILAILLAIMTTRTFDDYRCVRVFVGKKRVHESLFSIAWLAIGVFMILVGDPFDRMMGIMYIVSACIIIGKDHEDVKNFAFISDVFNLEDHS